VGVGRRRLSSIARLNSIAMLIIRHPRKEKEKNQ